MRKISSIRRHAYALAGLLTLAVAGCSKPAAASNESVATVNGEAIPMKDYVTYLERKPNVMVVTEQGPQEAQVAGMLGLQALRDLVNRKLILQLAKEDNVMPTEAQIKEELDVREKEQGNYVQQLTAQGIDLQTIKDDIQFILARENLQTKGITVPMADVDRFIKENPQNFMEPARASLLWIAVSDATKKALVDKDIQSGLDFQTVAVRYSEDPQARQTGGVFPRDIVAQMPAVVQGLVAKTPEAKATQWIQDGQNWLKFYVQKKTPAKKMDMNETRKRALQRRIAQERGRAANDITERIMKKLAASKIDVSPKQLRDPWEKMLEQAKNEMAQRDATATPSSAPGAAPAPVPGVAPSGTKPPATTGK
jgi:parvulin-like peptidyl-prolyl isomerase